MRSRTVHFSVQVHTRTATRSTSRCECRTRDHRSSCSKWLCAPTEHPKRSPTDDLIEDIEEAMKDRTTIEPDEYWGVAVPCNLEILYVLASRKWVGATLPKPETIAKWKRIYLEVWDATIDGLDPKPKHKKDRRRVLVKTFDQLAKLAKKKDD